MKKIPIKKAMVTWRPAYSGEPDCEVLEHAKRIVGKNLPMSTGACYTFWDDMTMAERKLMLMIEIWHLVARDGVPADKIHEAMQAIPEYDDMLSDDFSVYKKEA